MKMTWAKWWLEVWRLGRELGWTDAALNSMDARAWRDYWKDGYTPAEAWQEEYRE